MDRLAFDSLYLLRYHSYARGCEDAGILCFFRECQNKALQAVDLSQPITLEMGAPRMCGRLGMAISER